MTRFQKTILFLLALLLLLMLTTCAYRPVESRCKHEFFPSELVMTQYGVGVITDTLECDKLLEPVYKVCFQMNTDNQDTWELYCIKMYEGEIRPVYEHDSQDHTTQ